MHNFYFSTIEQKIILKLLHFGINANNTIPLSPSILLTG